MKLASIFFTASADSTKPNEQVACSGGFPLPPDCVNVGADRCVCPKKLLLFVKRRGTACGRRDSCLIYLPPLRSSLFARAGQFFSFFHSVGFSNPTAAGIMNLFSGFENPCTKNRG